MEQSTHWILPNFYCHGRCYGDVLIKEIVKHRIDILTGKQTGRWKGRQLRRRHSNFNVNFLCLCIFSLCEDEIPVFVIHEIKIRLTDKHLIKRCHYLFICTSQNSIQKNLYACYNLFRSTFAR